jgi:hypothetical protein
MVIRPFPGTKFDSITGVILYSKKRVVYIARLSLSRRLADPGTIERTVCDYQLQYDYIMSTVESRDTGSFSRYKFQNSE